MSQVIEALNTEDQDAAILAAMMGEIIEQEEAVEAAPVESEVLAVAADLERAEAVQLLYAEDDKAPEAATTEADTPKTEAVPKAAKAKKEAKAKPPKAPRVTSVTHKPGDLLMAKLGENARDFLVFDMDDAALDADALIAKQDAFIARMNVIIPSEPGYIADKVKEKAVMLFSWMKHGGKLNDVMQRAFTVLLKDGELISGNKGNLQLNLLSKPYTAGTSASQSNQMFMLFPLLSITVREKGKMVANPNSLILAKVKSEFGIA